jgi:hypothetical protein
MAGNTSTNSPQSPPRTDPSRAMSPRNPGDASRNPNTLSRAAPSEDAVRERAYALWEEAGRPEGDGTQFWLDAERELNGRH